MFFTVIFGGGGEADLWGGTLLTQKIFDAQNFDAGILTPGLLSLDGI